MNEPSPFNRVLETLAITPGEMALASGCTAGEVSRARQGGPIPRKLGIFLREAGVGIDDLHLEQERYRRQVAGEIRERVSGRGGPIPAHKEAHVGATK